MKIESMFDSEGHIFYNLIHETGDCITTISGVTTDEIQLLYKNDRRNIQS